MGHQSRQVISATRLQLLRLQTRSPSGAMGQQEAMKHFAITDPEQAVDRATQRLTPVARGRAVRLLG
jgi:hypothetical protein